MDIMKTSAIDLFCGIGGLSYGLKKAGIPVLAGIDLDASCRFAEKGKHIGSLRIDAYGAFVRIQFTNYSTHGQKLYDQE